MVCLRVNFYYDSILYFSQLLIFTVILLFYRFGPLKLIYYSKFNFLIDSN